MSGIYIHIPFCKQACNYCNFHFSTSLAQKEALIQALLKEVAYPADFIPAEEPIETIYLGGGTPSILLTDDLVRIFDALHKKFAITTDAEITLEANPDDITPEKLIAWTTMGINRLSVGIQSFLEEELTWMNRAHTAKESLAAIDTINDAGFTNYSIDLIFGSPLLKNEDWIRHLDIALKKNIPHISSYALTIEPSTALEKLILKNKRQPVDPEKQAEQFLLLMQIMEQAGYEHYEISNFAKPGMRSKHNSNYWKGKKYHGFGPAAHSFNGQNRRWNIANNSLYIQSIGKGVVSFEEEVLTKTQHLNEYIMTSLRTMEGLDLSYVTEIFGEKTSGELQVASNKYIGSSKMKRASSKLLLTKEGKLFADGIAADLFF